MYGSTIGSVNDTPKEQNVTRVGADDLRRLCRAALMEPESFGQFLPHRKAKLARSHRKHNREVLKALWANTENLTVGVAAKHFQYSADTLTPGSTASLALDDAVLALACEIDPHFASALLNEDDIPQTLPLTDAILRDLKATPKFQNTVLIACQHLMGSTVTQLRYLQQFGVPWTDMYIMGKPYSSNRGAAIYLRQQGALVHRVSDNFPAGRAALRSYQTSMLDAASDLIGLIGDRVRKDPNLQILVLDDGGLITSVLTEKQGLDTSQVVAVEQTTGGIKRWDERGGQPNFPLINVAESTAKVVFEAPSIASSIVAETTKRLDRLRGKADWRNEKVLLIGFGTVGGWVASVLTNEHAVKNLIIFDSSNRSMSTAMSVGYEVSVDLAKDLEKATVVIGCTGRRAFPERLGEKIRPDAILVSGSSGNVEFNGLVPSSRADRYMKQVDALGQGIMDMPFSKVHDDYRATNGRGKFWIANGGFPINFTGAADPISVEDIQITRTLMLAGALQAKKLFGHGVGLQKLDETYDTCIIRQYRKLQAKS